MGITVTGSGTFDKTEKALRHMQKPQIAAILNAAGREGVAALSAATPYATGETANSWYYQVETRLGLYSIAWYNSHVEKGAKIAILLQYGHGTGTGGYVQGRDYINPAMKTVFDKISHDVWRAVNT